MRDSKTRVADALARLGQEPNVWLATASTQGVPHLIPLSLAWNGSQLLLATPTNSPTVRNVVTSGRARAALDSADDVVLIDGPVEVVDFGSADPVDVESYVARVGWNPADQGGSWSLLRLQPRTVRAWNGVAEIEGRTIMTNGTWTD